MKLSTAQHSAIDAYRSELIKRRYKPVTVEGYCKAFKRYVQHIAPRLPSEVTPETIDEYLETLRIKNELSNGTVNELAKALRIYYE